MARYEPRQSDTYGTNAPSVALWSHIQGRIARPPQIRIGIKTLSVLPLCTATRHLSNLKTDRLYWPNYPHLHGAVDHVGKVGVSEVDKGTAAVESRANCASARKPDPTHLHLPCLYPRGCRNRYENDLRTIRLRQLPYGAFEGEVRHSGRMLCRTPQETHCSSRWEPLQN